MLPKTEKSEVLITAELIEAFAEVSGDSNPIHLDNEYAKTTMFRARIAHGFLTASFISAILGTKFPGSIYLSQSLQFKAPVKIGDIVQTVVQAIKLDNRKLTLSTQSFVGEILVLDGEALLLLPKEIKQ